MTNHILAHDPTPEPPEARKVANVFTSRLAASQPKPVLLADRLRWYAAKLTTLDRRLASDLARDAEAVAQIQQSLADTFTLLDERDAKILRLNETIQRQGGASQ